MKYSFTALAVAAIMGAASAQSLGSLVGAVPSCAVSCISDATSSATSCAATDFACACKGDNESAITAAASSCVLAACGASKLGDVVSATGAICAFLAANPSTPAASTSAAPETPATSEAPVAPATSVAAPVYGAPAVSSAAPVYGVPSKPAYTHPAGKAPLTVTVTICSTEVPAKPTYAPTAPSNYTAPTTSKPSVPVFTGAAANVAASFGSLAIAGLAVLAAL